MINLNEKQYMRLQTLFLCAFLFNFLLAGFHNRMWHEVFAAVIPEENIMSEVPTVPEDNLPTQQTADSGENTSDGFQPTAGETEITVYTYGEAIYTVQGMMDVIHPEDGTEEYFLEISGSVEKDETISDEAENMLENVHPDEFGDASVSLTIYDGEKVYGFYGNAKVTEGTEDSMQHIEIMGHKEGFYDGEEMYS